jgi:hypothetical protein
MYATRKEADAAKAEIASHVARAAARTEPRVYRMEQHKGWGNRIGWFQFPTRIEGHLRDRPKAGDRVTCQMKSGKVGVFEVREVDLMRDPPDQFFATVEPLGYEDD